jgi:hypothetical protein
MRRRFRWNLAMMVLISMCVVCSPAMAKDPYLSDMIKKPAYARALKSLLDHAGNLPTWTGEVLKPKGDNVEGPVTYASIDGTVYESFSNCESQNCSESRLEVMFAPDGAQAWGAFVNRWPLSYVYLGAPSEAQQAMLKKALGTDPSNPSN